MKTANVMDDKTRGQIIEDPAAILEDLDIMRALVGENERSMGANIVDLRGIAMERLEDRLDRLEDTHRSVIAAAYDNLAGTQQIHRAIVQLLSAQTFESFLHQLQSSVLETMRVDATYLVLETQSEHNPTQHNIREDTGILRILNSGFCNHYIKGHHGLPRKKVTLRHCLPQGVPLYPKAANITSEACLLLDFGRDTMPAMLVMGSQDPDHFSPRQGIDLLSFYASVLELSLQRWLA